MTKETQQKTTKSQPVKEHAGKKAVAVAGKDPRRKPKLKRPSHEKMVSPIGVDLEQVAGVPDGGQLGEAIGQLNSADHEAWQQLRTLLAEHLGSDAAGRLWLVTPAPGFVTTPLDEVRQGRATQLLAMLQSQRSASPTYA